MTAIPKALAMANPKHVFACFATVAGVISSKFAIDAVANKIDDTDIDTGKDIIEDKEKRPEYALTEEEMDYYFDQEYKCEKGYFYCDKTPEECEDDLYFCL